MKISAHRGYSGLYPENTMISFKKAFEAGCDEIELDVQMTKDKVLVIIHDESIKRTTDGEGYVRKYTLEELQKFNAAAVIKDTTQFHQIPTFEEYIAWVKTTNLSTNIELKNSKFYYTNLEVKVIELLKSYDMLDRVMFSSFNHLSLAKCKQLAPEVPCGILTEREIGNAGYYAKNNGMECYHPDITKLTKTAVDNCRKHNIEINTWTVNDMAEMRKALDWNLDGVITNFPDLCKCIKENYTK